MNISNKTYKILTKAGWYPGRKVDIQVIKDIFKERDIEMFESAEKFLSEFSMIETHFHLPNGNAETFHFNPLMAIGDCFDKEYFDDLEDQYSDIIGESLVPIGEADRRYLILLITPTSKIFGYYDGCLVKFGDNVEASLEALCWGNRTVEILHD